jgi:hypothetical protein
LSTIGRAIFLITSRRRRRRRRRKRRKRRFIEKTCNRYSNSHVPEGEVPMGRAGGAPGGGRTGTDAGREEHGLQEEVQGEGGYEFQ